MTDYQRFINVINWLKESRKIFNNADLANVLGVSQTYVSLLMTEKKPITANLVKNLVNKFNELNEIWILTGEGSMLKVDATATSRDEINQTGTYNNVHGDNNVNADSTINALIERIKEKDEQISRLITIIEHKL